MKRLLLQNSYPKMNLNLVKHDENIINKFINAYQWICLLRDEFNTLKIEDKPYQNYIQI